MANTNDSSTRAQDWQEYLMNALHVVMVRFSVNGVIIARAGERRDKNCETFGVECVDERTVMDGSMPCPMHEQNRRLLFVFVHVDLVKCVRREETVRGICLRGNITLNEELSAADGG